MDWLEALESAEPAWMSEAACRGLGVEMFYNDDPTDALAVRRDCPVREPCLAYAMTVPYSAQEGVWGGLTDRDRGHSHWRRRATA